MTIASKGDGTDLGTYKQKTLADGGLQDCEMKSKIPTIRNTKRKSKPFVKKSSDENSSCFHEAPEKERKSTKPPPNIVFKKPKTSDETSVAAEQKQKEKPNPSVKKPTKKDGKKKTKQSQVVC